ncbi:hypothetical protein FRC06_009322 [Ceratobasidium sp. 370]|nr:hypothetical protein FRC06_009322 [Ceratobasidium sp. 370]
MPPSRKRPAEGPAAERPPTARQPALDDTSGPFIDWDNLDSIKWSNKVEKSLTIIGSHFRKWELDPSILTNCPQYQKNVLSKCSDLVHLLNRIDKLFASLGCPKSRLPCLSACPASKSTAQVAVDTSDLPSPALAVVHKSVLTDPFDEPMAIDPPPPPAPHTYASVATETVATPQDPTPTDPKPVDPKTPTTMRPKPKGLGVAPPRSAGLPVRLIVCPAPSMYTAGMPFASLFLGGPSQPYRLLSHALSLTPSTRDVTLLGAHQNRRKNLVISLAPGTSDEAVAATIPVACRALTTDMSPTPAITRDTPWSKLLVSSVPARSETGAPTHLEADVQASLLRNPAISALKITRPPRWIRNPASITGAHSSFTFSFEDPDGSLARQLAKSSLFIFGVPVHLRRWIDKPLAKRK